MAWIYADYEQQKTAAARLDRAEKFHAELLNATTKDVDSDGTSVRHDAITRALDRLEVRLPQLRTDAASEKGVGTTYGSFA